MKRALMSIMTPKHIKNN